MTTLISREHELLRAALMIMEENDMNGGDIGSCTSVWDGTVCDGYTLMQEIEDLLVDSDVDITRESNDTFYVGEE